MTGADFEEAMATGRKIVADLYNGAASPIKLRGDRAAQYLQSDRDGIQAVLRGLAALVVDAQSTIATLQARVSELEKTGIRYQGVWDIARTYELGDAVTFDGSVWRCNERTTSRPGTDAGWKLIVKRGQNGRKDKR